MLYSNVIVNVELMPQFQLKQNTFLVELNALEGL